MTCLLEVILTDTEIRAALQRAALEKIDLGISSDKYKASVSIDPLEAGLFKAVVKLVANV